MTIIIIIAFRGYCYAKVGIVHGSPILNYYGAPGGQNQIQSG